MSISKLLMTSAVCAMSMAAVSTSYGSSESFQSSTADEPATPSGEQSRAADSMSQYSSASIRNTHTNTVLKAIGAELTKELANDVVFPTGDELKGKRSVEQLQVIISKLLRRYLGMRPIVTAFVETRDVILPEAAKTPVTDLDATKTAMIAQVKKQTKALEDAETALADTQTALAATEKSKSTWQNTTIATGGVLVVVTGILLNIIKNHGWAILWGK